MLQFNTYKTISHDFIEILQVIYRRWAVMEMKRHLSAVPEQGM